MNSTISISHELKEKIRSLGRAGDSYEDVIEKMYAVTKQHLLTAYLYDTSDSISIKEARKKLNGKSRDN